MPGGGAAVVPSPRVATAQPPASTWAGRGLPRVLVAVALAAVALLTLAHGLACAPHGASGGSAHTSVLANPVSAVLPIEPHAAPRGPAHADPRPGPRGPVERRVVPPHVDRPASAAPLRGLPSAAPSGGSQPGFFAYTPLPEAGVPHEGLDALRGRGPLGARAPDVFPPGRAAPPTVADDGPWSVTAATAPADPRRTADSSSATRLGDLGTDRTVDSGADRSANPGTADRSVARPGSPYGPAAAPATANAIRVAAAVAGAGAHGAVPAHPVDTPAAATPEAPTDGTGAPVELPCDSPAGCARQAVPNTAAPPLGGLSPLLPPPVAADPFGVPGPLAPLARQRCVKRALPGHRPVLDLVCVSRT